MNYKLARVNGKYTGGSRWLGIPGYSNNKGIGGGGGKVSFAEMQTITFRPELVPATHRSPLESNPSCLGDSLG